MIKTFLVYIPLCLLCIASFQYRVYDGGPAFHGDESNWLANARAFWLFVDRDFDNEYWQEYDGWTQPHAGHYVYALVLRAAGIRPEQLHRRYSPMRDLNWNVLEGRVPSRRVLLTGRRFSALCGALACIVICEIGRRTFGWGVGLVAACWLAANPLMRYVCQRAMIDGQLTLALAAGILVLLILYRGWQRWSWWVVLLVSVPVGLFFGFAAALKFNGGILCAIAITALPCLGLHVYLWHRGGQAAVGWPRRTLLGAVGSVTITGTMAIGTFYVLNPQMWQKGLADGMDHVLALRKRDSFVQQTSHPDAALLTIGERFSAGVEMYFVRWPSLRTAPLKDFRNASQAGTHQRGMWYVEGPLFLFGIAGLVWGLIARARRDHRIDPACIVALWAVSYSVFSFAGIPLLWPRYFQKYLLIQALLVGIGLRVLLDVVRWFRTVRRGTEAGATDSAA